VFASGKPHHPIAKEALNVGQRICALCGTAADYKNVDATSSIQLDVATQNYKTHATHSNVALMLQHNTCDTFEHCIDVATHATHATHLNVH
jgi:putative NADH-flavin reductase